MDGGTSMTVTVDADLFDTFMDAVAFVAERGGGVVYSELADTPFLKALKLPEGVEIKPPDARDGLAITGAWTIEDIKLAVESHVKLMRDMGGVLP